MQNVLRKNQIVSLQIDDFGVNGEGVGKTDGFPVFVQGAVIGDTVRAGITKVKKTYAYARTEEILTASPDRVPASCPVADKCGGCQLQAYDYAAQLRYKESLVKNALVRIGRFDASRIDDIVAPVIGMDDPGRYRNKAQYPVGCSRTGDTVCGFYATHSHRIIPADDCLICSACNRDILSVILSHMRQYHIAPYREETGEGLLRHILIREGHATGEIMVCLVVNRPYDAATETDVEQLVPGIHALSEQLMRLPLTASSGQTYAPHIMSVCVNYNPDNTNVIMGRHTRTVAGRHYIEDRLSGLTFRISAQSFYQVNPVQTEQLYALVTKFAALTGHETVWDLYCGIGTIALTLAHHGAGHVTGVEAVPQAVEDAGENARINGIGNADFIAGKAEEVVPQDAHPDVVVVDPPRKGCDATCLHTILHAAPSRIVYVSCNPATLARDLLLLADGGYHPVRIQPVDLFPHSVHVETATLLQRQNT